MRTRRFLVLLIAGSIGPVSGQSSSTGQTPQRQSPGPAASCEGLASLTLPRVAITLARTVDAGAFTPPGASQALAALPPFCRVAATLKPSSDSDIKIEVWLPATNWNGKFQAVGNGGVQRFDSLLRDGGRAPARLRDRRDRHRACRRRRELGTGASGESDRFRLARGPRDVCDVEAHHRRATTTSGPRFSYWNGCSAGGRQGMKEAQRFPADFDGIIAGAPALDWTARAATGGAGRADAGEDRRSPPACGRNVNSCTRPSSRRATPATV